MMQLFKKPLAAAFLVGLFMLPAISIASPEPWDGPEGAAVYAEAETFTIEGDGWELKDMPRHFQSPFVSTQTLAGSSKGTGTAHTTLHVPEDGEYIIWVRHSEYPKVAKGWRAPFKLTIMQDGEPSSPTFEQTYDHKLFKVGVGGTAAWERYHWVPSRDWETRESFTVKLKKGDAKLTFSKLEPFKCHPKVRQIDAVLLTTDTEYEPDYRDFVPQTYMRVRLHELDQKGCYFYTFLDQMREPWYRNVAFDMGGFAESIQGDRDQWVEPGEQTPWVNISRLLYSGWTTNFFMRAQLVYGKLTAEHAHYTVDFATAPNEESILKSIVRKGEGPAIAIQVPADMTVGKRPLADYEIAKQVADVVSTFPKIEFGKRPTKFPCLLGIPTNDGRVSPMIGEHERVALKWMGISGNSNKIRQEDIDDGLVFGRLHSSIWHMGPDGYNDIDYETLNQRLKAQAESLKKYKHIDNMVQNKLMDEASASSLTAMTKRSKDLSTFRKWVDEKGYLPFDFGVETMDELLLTDDPDHEEPLLYYLSQRFRAWTVANFFRTVTEHVHKHLKLDVGTTQNFSDGAVYQANMYSQGNDYWEWFENQQALDIAMSEDWTNSGATNQLTSWNVALLRAAVRKHGQPIHMYVISSYGRRPLDIKLKAYSDIAQGAKMLNFYSYQPTYAGHERGWYEQWPRYAAVGEVCHEIGAVEDVLMDAMPRRAEAAILYSTTYDLWEVKRDNVLAHERMLSYLALKHGQIPVDVISEREAAKEDLSSYKVIYLFGEHIDQKTIEPLADWVKAGGTLVITPAAASKNHLDRKSSKLDKALGIKRDDPEKLQNLRHSSVYLCRLIKPQGSVKIMGSTAGEATLAYRKQTFSDMKDAEVLATFEDGAPAAVHVTKGQGHVYMFGFLPAVSYTYGARTALQASRDADPPIMVSPLKRVAELMAMTEEEHKGKSPNEVQVEKYDHTACPDEWDAAERDLICLPAIQAGVELPVKVSAPLVEATFMTGSVGWIIPLANYTTKAIDSLTVTIQPGKPHAEIHSARLGKLQATANPDGSSTVTIPLESTDFVYANWQ